MNQAVVQVVRGCGSIVGYILNTLIWCGPLLLIALVKVAVPLQRLQNGCRRMLVIIANCWISVNNVNQRLLTRTRLKVSGLDGLSTDGWYLVVANHQSWVDILVLQHVLHRKIPLLKFFVKKELFWFPLLGQAWWALDFPFMKRYNRQVLKKYPHLIGKDLEITRKACEKFSMLPVSIMNFVEGTRFTPEKHKQQRSPYTHLLRTRAGGMAFVLAAMSDRLEHIVDATIAYPLGKTSFWDYACGRIPCIQVHVRTLPIGQHLRGDYLNDLQFKKRFQDWLNGLWLQKDKRIAAMLAD